MALELIIPFWVTLALAGGLGQLLRALAGVKKAVDRGETIHVSRLLSSVFYAMVTGGTIGYFSNSPELAFAAGYGVTDFTESLVGIVQERGKAKEKTVKKKEE